MERYESYKPSGAEWIGDIPSSWSSLRAKYIFREIDDRSLAGDEELLSVSHLTGVTPRSEKNITMFMAEDYTGAKLCREGDLVINTMWAWMGALGVSKLPGIVSPAYGVYRQQSDCLIPQYADWLLRTPNYIAEYTRRSTGVNSSRLRLYPDRFLDMPILIPPRSDQERIVTFLKRKTAEVDAAISKKERLIDLLLQQKTILINRVVTQGIGFCGRLRDCGIGWIGKIPLHWSLAPAYTKFDIQLGKMLDSKKITGRHLRRYLRNTDIQWEQINSENLPEMDIRPNETERYTVRNGDLLVCEGGDIGRCAIWCGPSHEIGFQKALHRVRPIADLQVEYFRLFMLTASAAGALASGANTNTISHLTAETFRRMRVLCPPVKEQAAIALYARQVEMDTNDIIDRTKHEITSLREFQSALIANVVTGQIRT